MADIIVSYLSTTVHSWNSPYGCDIAFMAILTSMAFYIMYYRPLSSDYHSIKPYTYNTQQRYREILLCIMAFVAFFCFDGQDDFFSCFPMNGVKSLKDLLKNQMSWGKHAEH